MVTVPAGPYTFLASKHNAPMVNDLLATARVKNTSKVASPLWTWRVRSESTNKRSRPTKKTTTITLSSFVFVIATEVTTNREVFLQTSRSTSTIVS